MAEPTPAPEKAAAPASPTTSSAPAAASAPAGDTKPASAEKTADGGGEKAQSIQPAPGSKGVDVGKGSDQGLMGGPMGIVILLGLPVMLYFMLIHPQRKRDKARREMLGKLKVGDRVLTAGGVVGEIAEMSDDEVVLKIDARKDVRMRLRRWAIAGPANEAASEQTVKEQSGN